MMGYREQKCREEVKTGEVMRTFLLSDRDKYIDGFSGLFQTSIILVNMGGNPFLKRYETIQVPWEPLFFLPNWRQGRKYLD